MSPGLLAHAEQVAQEFDFDPDNVSRAAHHFLAQMRQALGHNSAIQIPSYVTKVPTGHEKGVFLAVDLGGTNCRVCWVQFHGDSTYTVVETKHIVPRELRVNPSHKPLFRFIAEKIRDFLQKHAELGDTKCDEGVTLPTDLNGESYWKLGFTFSFTFEQDSLAHGSMIQWDKGWDIPDALGRDPCAMLQTAIDELTLPVRVAALTNDSVGTLMTRSYTSGSPTLVGAIFGTGTNAAYAERLSNVTKLHDREAFSSPGRDDLMVLNTEWGGLDSEKEVLPTTRYDDMLDLESTNPKSQLLEKRVSGLYLGELLRLVILQLLEANLFDMVLDEDSPVTTPESIDSSFLSHVAGDRSQSLEKAVLHIAQALRARDVSAGDARAIRVISMAIARRGARLAGAALAAIILQSGRLEVEHPPPKSRVVAYQEHELKSPTSESGSFGFFSKPLSHLRRLIRGLLRRLGLDRLSCLNPPPHAPLVADTAVPGEDVIDIGVDGSLIEFYPGFEEDIRGALREVPEIGVEGERRVRIGPAKNGSSVGAALVAQSASL
ncbi:Phosphotransferase [Pleurostoma richardsiae]|uniref:Phosphotransferase n=1 Tax=Pleurostoma richardsiae TaxID=41990 RepID=A0AA38RFI6_9PEZI|nr:Phosphotransferase [Pleurostoma richardsiae]